MKDILKYKVLALVPEYTEEGANFTKILLYNKESIVVTKNINSSLKSVCDFYHFDLKSSSKTAKSILGIKKSPPIAISQDLVFIAIKTRNPIGKDDGAYSYINIEMIGEVKEGELLFKDKTSLKIISSTRVIEKAIKYANILKELILSRRIDRITLVRDSEEFYLEDSQGLRKDLDIIYRKLQTIEKTLFK